MSIDRNRNIYVGHRYVPLIDDEWDKTKSYEGLTVVTHKGGSYTSKKRVPVGIEIDDNEFWAFTGNYNAQVEHYRQEVKEVSTGLKQRVELKEPKTVITVGDGGDFQTINEALNRISYFKPEYEKATTTSESYITNRNVEILLLSGFVMNEQVMVEGGVDFGFVTISAEDGTVPVERAALKTVSTNNYKPLFSAHYNSELPIINALFVVNNPGNIKEVDDLTTGVQVVNNSKVIVSRNAGVKGVGRGLYINSGNAVARGAIFDDNTTGIRVSQGGHVEARDIRARNCGTALRTAHGVTADFRGIDTTGSNQAISAIGFSTVNAGEAILKDIKENAISASQGVDLGLVNAVIEGNNNNPSSIGIQSFGSIIRLTGATVTGFDRDIFPRDGSIITANNVTTSHSDVSGIPSLSDVVISDFNHVESNGIVITNSAMTKGLQACIQTGSTFNVSERNARIPFNKDLVNNGQFENNVFKVGNGGIYKVNYYLTVYNLPSDSAVIIKLSNKGTDTITERFYKNEPTGTTAYITGTHVIECKAGDELALLFDYSGYQGANISLGATAQITIEKL